MSGGHGRRAALPPVGYRPSPRVDPVDGLTVRFVPEDRDQQPVEFDLAAWPLSLELRRAFARALLARTRQHRGIRTTDAARRLVRRLEQFAAYLAALDVVPRTAGQLTATQVKGWALQHAHLPSVGNKLGSLKALLRNVEGIQPEFAAFLTEREPRRLAVKTHGYSRSEFTRIVNTARREARAVAQRIHHHRRLLDRWHAGDLDGEARDVQRLGRILDHVERYGDVPRDLDDRHRVPFWVHSLGGVDEHIGRLHLTNTDAVAFVILLIGVTGQNLTTITDAPAAHHRPDGFAGGTPTAIVELDKRRRGPRRHMDVPLVGLPGWITIPSATTDAAATPEVADVVPDLRTPFGVYMLLHDLTASARLISGSDRLLVWYSRTGGKGMRRGFRSGGILPGPIADWAAEHELCTDAKPGADSRTTTRLRVTAQRLRLTFNELHQRPVAHTEATLANEYLLRNQGNLAEYQRVVADALDQEIAKATTVGRIGTLSPADVAEAHEHPARVAARFGLDAATLTRMLSGALDTVMTACADNTNSPHAPAGEPCTASFMACLGCPCARAMPSHLPLQVLVHDRLERRRAEVTPLRWARRFAKPHAQLADLLERAGTVAVADARKSATIEQNRLADRFLNRELDLS